MKHYADDQNRKSEPRHGEKPGGKRYAETEKQPRYIKNDRFEKKEVSLRVKQPKPQSDDGKTKVYPMKKSDVAKLSQQPKVRRARTECPATPTAPKPQMKAGYLPAFLFGGFILAMAVWFIFSPKAAYSASEKRVLADFPNTSAENVFSGQFGKEFETYFADHFPARNLWVGVNSYTTLFEGNNGASGVYNCSDGYLINKPIPKDNQLDKNLDILAEFKEIVGDVPVNAMFVPSTGYIAQDKLPLVHDDYNDDTYFNRAAKKLKTAGIGFIDLRTDFQKAYKNNTQLYYRTDHHWTTEGAYTAYCALCEKLGLSAVSKSAFNIEKYDGFFGTTYSTSGFWLTPPDTVEVWNNPKNTEDKISVTIAESNRTIESNSMFFYEHDNEDDKYPIFIDGNHALTEITNKNAKGGTIVVVKDSFSHCFAPFLAENYSKVILVDMRYYSQEVSQIVKVEKPEQVLVLYGMDNFATDTDIVNLW